MMTYGEVLFNSVDKFGDNGNRVDYYMLSPSFGQVQIVKYVPDSGKRGSLNGIFIGAGYNRMCTSGAYAAAASGALIKVNVGSTTRMEHRLQWTGLSGYEGGSDDMGCETELYIPMYNQPVAAADAVTLYVTAALATRPIVYQTNLHGYLSSGAPVHTSARTVIGSTTETAITIYTVPAGTTLAMQCLSVSLRIADGYIGKCALFYNGVPIFPFDLLQSDIGSMCGLSIPIMGADISETTSLGFNVDSYNCIDETVNCLMVSREEPVARFQIIGGGHVIHKVG